MKKIMFNDKYGLTEAVLQGRKTMTRRVATWETVKEPKTGFLTEQPEAGTFVLCNRLRVVAKSTYKLGEVVAVAQAYRDCKNNHEVRFDDVFGTIGWNNKMFVCADLMPHQIKFADIKAQRLQDISDEDCMREGIQAFDTPGGKVFVAGGVYVGQDARLKIAKGMINIAKSFKTPQEAFAVLIDRVSGKGTWDANPWVFAYSFELV